MYEIDVEFVINSPHTESSGFSMLLLKNEPEFPRDSGVLNGIRKDLNGVGVFLYRSKNRNVWVSTHQCK